MPPVSEQVEWLNLVDRSGPFLSPKVIEGIFPQGLEAVVTSNRQRLRSAHEEWCDAVDQADPRLSDLHGEWIRLVLQDCLEYEDAVLVPREKLAGVVYRAPEHGVEISPDYAVRSEDGKIRILIAAYPPGTDPTKPLAKDSWPASPIERMTLLCRANQVRSGLITNGESWTLVNAPVGGTSGWASWLTRIWWQEPITLKAFQSLLGVRRLFGPDGETLDSLLEKSLEFQEEVTDTLGEQVRRAVEVLVQALGRADQDRNGELLKDVSPAVLYEAGLTVMMRLVVTLCAEERELLLLGDPIYDQHYAISTLRAKLREDADKHGVQVLERMHDAWSRMLAVFRAIYGGIDHEALRLPALGGSLFDPDRFPFLEGRPAGSSWKTTPASPLPIDNRTALLMLSALQVLEQKRGAQTLSYRGLDVEQIGHVYEGLLEYTAIKVDVVTVGLIGSGKVSHSTIGLDELESLIKSGVDEAKVHLAEVTGRSQSAIRNSLKEKGDEEAFKQLMYACGGDEILARRLQPFAGLIRADSWGTLLVYRPGSFSIAPGTSRRSTGTHYTPKSLTEPIVEHTLEPLVYVGPAEGIPRGEWKLKSPSEILDLKICDMAMGSGAFLVQACRYLGDRLVEAWAVAELTGKIVTVDGASLDSLGSEERITKVMADRVIIARRLVVGRILYGVDINPIAVELGKLSLWLITMMRNRPFGFIDHALKCGDSLLGVASIKQVECFSLKPDGRQITFATAQLAQLIDHASAKRCALEILPSNDSAQIEIKRHLHAEVESATSRAKALADALIVFELRGLSGEKYEEQRAIAAEKAEMAVRGPLLDFQSSVRQQLQGRGTFHWPLEFPEVFQQGGFHAFIGNPPFMGGLKISGTFGDSYRRWLDAQYPHGGGRADLCAYFLLRAADLKQNAGTLGMIATNTIAEGETCDTGLTYLVSHGQCIYHACRSITWPGTANLSVSLLHLVRSENWRGAVTLDGEMVHNIAPSLTHAAASIKPHKLLANDNLSFQGANVHGMGFILTDEEAKSFMQLSDRNSECIFRFMNGDDLNNEPGQEPTRWVIDFRDRSLEICESRWPLLMRRVREQVKPVRDHQKDKRAREKWWCHYRPANALYDATRNLKRFLATCEVTKHLSFSFIRPGWVLSSNIDVIALAGEEHFAVLQSTIHEAWARVQCSHLETRLKYSNGNAYETFPFPISTARLKDIGGRYCEMRQAIMFANCEGLTDTYNRFHNPNETADDIVRLRALHVEMDSAVLSAYGWTEFELGHDFRETGRGVRFTISEYARRASIDHLRALNRQRYEEELKMGLNGKKIRRKSGEMDPKPKAKDRKKEIDLFEGAE